MWEWMVLALKVAIGGFLWGVVGFLVMLCIGVLFYFLNKEGIEEFAKSNGIKKPKWNGEPIVIKGEKKKDE